MSTLYEINRKQARMVLEVMNAADQKLPPPGKSLYVCLANGIVWRFTKLAEDLYQLVMDDTQTSLNNPKAPASTDSREQWIPASGGTETPFKARNGMTLLYMWNKLTGEHAYLNTGTDIFLTNEEAAEAMGNV
jgi:hypothetical protein